MWNMDMEYGTRTLQLSHLSAVHTLHATSPFPPNSSKLLQLYDIMRMLRAIDESASTWHNPSIRWRRSRNSHGRWDSHRPCYLEVEMDVHRCMSESDLQLLAADCWSKADWDGQMWNVKWCSWLVQCLFILLFILLFIYFIVCSFLFRIHIAIL
jgi:hypothetical protein